MQIINLPSLETAAEKKNKRMKKTFITLEKKEINKLSITEQVPVKKKKKILTNQTKNISTYYRRNK